MTAAGEDDIMLKLLHTADWHLGRLFRGFPEEGALKLSRARLEVLDRILLAADRYAVDAVLCAGDLFDEPSPAKEWWEQAAARLRKHSSGKRPMLSSFGVWTISRSATRTDFVSSHRTESTLRRSIRERRRPRRLTRRTPATLQSSLSIDSA